MARRFSFPVAYHPKLWQKSLTFQQMFALTFSGYSPIFPTLGDAADKPPSKPSGDR